MATKNEQKYKVGNLVKILSKHVGRSEEKSMRAFGNLYNKVYVFGRVNKAEYVVREGNVQRTFEITVE